MLDNNVGRLRTCSFFLLVNKRQTVCCDWLAVVNIMAAEWTDAPCVAYTNYTSPFYLYIIHDCTQTDFGRLRLRLRAIKQITAAATSSSSAESTLSSILLSNKMLSCVTQMFANKCWPTNVVCLRLNSEIWAAGQTHTQAVRTTDLGDKVAKKRSKRQR